MERIEGWITFDKWLHHDGKSKIPSWFHSIEQSALNCSVRQCIQPIDSLIETSYTGKVFGAWKRSHDAIKSPLALEFLTVA